MAGQKAAKTKVDFFIEKQHILKKEVKPGMIHVKHNRKFCSSAKHN